MYDFIMPSLGADMKEGILVAWRVAPGDRVAHGDIVAEVETQKGVFEVEAFASGIVGPLLVQPGPERIPVGTVLTTIGAPGDTPSTVVPEKSAAVVQQPVPPPAESQPVSSHQPNGERLKISPVARRLAAERQLGLAGISGSGPDGVITLADVEQALAERGEKSSEIQQETAPATTDFQAGMRQAIAAAMSLSNREIPHYYLAADIDMSRALRWLEERNRQRSIRDRLLPVVLPLKATALALRKVPELNAHWIDDQLQLRDAV
ncbi:MAG: 2-oxo acid dehydrogenase subunit E2, partial [Desulfuromonas sp.]